MKPFICYNKVSGQIQSYGWIPASTPCDDNGDLAYIIHEYSGETHVEDGVTIKKRQPDMILQKQLRDKRNKLLATCDWTQLPDIPENIRQRYAQYRKKLRDFPANCADYESPEWPTLDVGD